MRFLICILVLLVVQMFIILISKNISKIESSRLNRLMDIYDNGFKNEEDYKFFRHREKEMEINNMINSLFK